MNEADARTQMIEAIGVIPRLGDADRALYCYRKLPLLYQAAAVDGREKIGCAQLEVESISGHQRKAQARMREE